MKNSIFLAWLLVTAFAASSPAATQGTLGKTSSGTVHISITKPIRAEVDGMHDITLQAQSYSDQSVCIYSATGNYHVTAYGDGTLHAFTVSSGGLEVPYTLSWNNHFLSPNTASKTLTAQSAKRCSGASFAVNLPQEQLEQKSYHGILTVIIATD